MTARSALPCAPNAPVNDGPADQRPLVILPACNRIMKEHPLHVVGKKYADAVRLAHCMPLIVPNADPTEMNALLAIADGVFLTGASSNVHASHFNEDILDASLPLDPARDAWTLPLIRAALARGLPLLAICRGAQETNVALGGSLYQAVHQIEGKHDHRGPDNAPAAVQYGVAHEVIVEPGGRLATLTQRARFEVNSVHGQAVNRLAEGCRVEARSPDGLIEAFSVTSARGFNLCVQWHPEWLAAENPISMAILNAFGLACSQYRAERRQAGVPSPNRH